MKSLAELKICKRCGQPKSPPRDRMTGLCCQCDADSTCRHYHDRPHGLIPKDWTCPAGMQPINLAGYGPGCMTRIPCRWCPPSMIDGEKATCDKFEPSDIEGEYAWDRAVEESDRWMRLTMPLIAKVKQEHRGSDWRGNVPCPTGCGGTLRLSHSAINGHVWGACTTEDCLSWME